MRWKHYMWSVTYSSKQPIFYTFKIIGMNSCFVETSCVEAIKESRRRCSKTCFAVKCCGKHVCPQQSRAIELKMQGAISFILMVIFLLFLSLTDADELQSNTSTSKCKVDTKFRSRTGGPFSENCIYNLNHLENWLLRSFLDRDIYIQFSGVRYSQLLLIKVLKPF